MEVCEECGSPNVQSKAWVNTNTHKFIEFSEDGEDYRTHYCEVCDKMVYLVSSDDNINIKQSWLKDYQDRDLKYFVLNVKDFLDSISPEEAIQFSDMLDKYNVFRFPKNITTYWVIKRKDYNFNSYEELIKHCRNRYIERVIGNSNSYTDLTRVILYDLNNASNITSKLSTEVPRFILFIKGKYGNCNILKYNYTLFICKKRKNTLDLYDVVTCYMDKDDLRMFRNSVLTKEDIHLKLKLLKYGN